MTNKVEFFAPHRGQRKIQRQARRFNVLPIPRRFGKSDLTWKVFDEKAERGGPQFPLIYPAMFEGKFVGLFSPEFKDVLPTWEGVVENFEPLIAHKDATARVVEFKGGGRLDFWSIPNVGSKEKGRGRKYHRVLYDEAQKVPDEVLRHHFTAVSLPTLADFKGDCFILGSPSGKGTYFYELAQMGTKIEGTDIEPSKTDFPEWFTHRLKTTDNPFIDPHEIEQLRLYMDDAIYRQEFLGEFIDYAGDAWCYAIKSIENQQRIFKKNLRYDKARPILLSFDFNKRPMTAVAAQMWPNGLSSHPDILANTFSRPSWGCNILKAFKTSETEQSSIYDVCRLIREWVYEITGMKIGIWPETPHISFPCSFILATGDASGDISDGRQKQPMTYYDIICDELGLVRDSQLIIPSVNPYHTDSFVQVNNWIAKNPEFFIDEEGAAELKKDIFLVKANPDRSINKKDAMRSHLLDCFRYLLWSFGKA